MSIRNSGVLNEFYYCSSFNTNDFGKKINTTSIKDSISYLEIFKELGMIKHNKVEEVQRSDLVADHIGGTAKLTEKALKDAEGSVLFIDEAYRLTRTSNKDFGKEAMETIMAKLNPDPKGKLCYPVVIFAGYTKEMKEFINTNPGFSRRVKFFFTFADFMPAELAEITNLKLLSKKKDIH